MEYSSPRPESRTGGPSTALLGSGLPGRTGYLPYGGTGSPGAQQAASLPGDTLLHLLAQSNFQDVGSFHTRGYADG